MELLLLLELLLEDNDGDDEDKSTVESQDEGTCSKFKRNKFLWLNASFNFAFESPVPLGETILFTFNVGVLEAPGEVTNPPRSTLLFKLILTIVLGTDDGVLLLT